MRKVFKNNSHHGIQNGSALVVVMIALLVGAIVIGMMFVPSQLKMKIVSMFRKGSVLQLKAESGFDLAKSDILDRAMNGDFNSVVALDTAQNTGLIYAANRDPLLPRINMADDHIALKVYYFPDKQNGPVDGNGDPIIDPNHVDHNLKFPKFYHIVSEATNLKTGDQYTMEGLLNLRLENWAEFSFGMLNPKVPPGATQVRFKPATYSGHVHFGAFDDPNVAVWFHYGGGNPRHEFLGPVTFGWATPSGQDHPFRYHSHINDLYFHKGYIDNYQLQADPEPIFNRIQQTARLTFGDDVPEHVCLKFMPTGGGGDGTKGIIHRYECAPEEWSVFRQYQGEVTTYDENGVVTQDENFVETAVLHEAPVDTYNADGILYFPNKTVHVKGIVNGALTIAAQRLVIAGDIQHLHQGPTSGDRLGLLALEDIEIPFGVPHGASLRLSRIKSSNPAIQPHTGVTNFVVPNDRDTPEGTSEPIDNMITDLDIDAMLMSVQGGLYVQGINDRVDPNDPNDSGVLMPGVDGQIYSLNPNAPNYYYTQDGDGNWGRVVDPMYGGDWRNYGYNSGTNELRPLLFHEHPRPANQDNIRIYGGLVVNDFTNTAVGRSVPCYSGTRVRVEGIDAVEIPWNDTSNIEPNCSGDIAPGFKKKVIEHDSRFHRFQPPGFPDTDKPILQVEWMKRYRGASAKVTN